MDLKQIESFVRVAELGSFTRAAAALGMPQPLLSRHVRQLEVELRQTFLWRNGRGVTLTEAGGVLLEHGRGILHQASFQCKRHDRRQHVAAVRRGVDGVAVGLQLGKQKVEVDARRIAFGNDARLAGEWMRAAESVDLPRVGRTHHRQQNLVSRRQVRR